jgi:hypothetical protein
MTAKDHLEKAAAIVNGDRQRDYGHPRNNHSCTADLFNAYMDRRGVARLDAQDVCVFNILQKLSRFANRRTDDSVTDIIGYALNIAMCGEATDTPGNTDAAPREVDEKAVVRCFEWIGRADPFLNAVVRFDNGALTGLRYDGEKAGGETLVGCIENDTWREFPASEWFSKVAAVKAASTPCDTTPALSDQTADTTPALCGEWPKWTNNGVVLRMWVAENAQFSWTGKWNDERGGTFTEYSMYPAITRAEAVALIGESAVAEGERLAGVCG